MNIHVLSKIVFLLLPLLGCQSEKGQMVSWSGKTMGTTYSVKMLISPDEPLKIKQKEIDQTLEGINLLFSTYLPNSEISKVNSKAFKNQPIQVSPEFAKLLEFSLNSAELTKGYFDPTVGPLVNLWGFGPQKNRKVPSKDEVQKTLQKVGYQKVRLDNHYITFLESEMYLDFSAFAKGYAVDEVFRLLVSREVNDFMVEIGGEVRTQQTRFNKVWKIGIETPSIELGKKAIKKVLSLKNLSLATSGNYRNFYEAKGNKYAHTIDIHTGRPAPRILASVSVLSQDSCMKADMYATALMAMGPEKGLHFANKKNIAAYFIFKDSSGKFKVESSKNFELFQSE